MGRKRIAVLLLLLLFCGSTVLADDSTDYKIEQVYINMPEVTAYYRAPQQSDNVEAYLGGEQLGKQEIVRFADCGEAIEYYVLLDISASIRGSRFEDIRSSLNQFLSEMRENDQMILLTFGDAVNTVLSGTESREEAANAISQLTNADQNTVLFEAIDQAADMIWSAGDSSEKHRVAVVISDGKDCADNTRNVDSVETRLVSRGIPLYTLAVENNEGDSEEQISDYRGKFGALSRDTGGLPWGSTEESSVLDGLLFVRDAVMGSYRAKFAAETNEISNSREDFVMKFPDAGNMSDTVSILVGRAQKDDTPPEILSAISEESNSITITYSEAVQNADDLNHYSVRKDGKAIPVLQIVQSAAEANTYALVFSDDLYEGDYDIQINGVTDVSNEKNGLSNASLTVQTTWKTPEPESDTEIETEAPKESALDQVLKWWPVALTVILLLLIIIVIVILRRLKKRQNVLIVDEKEIQADQVDIRKHVKMSQPGLPSRHITLWIDNGGGDARQMDVQINGSCIIGRAEQCDVYCDDPMMSKQHFVLEVQDGGLFVTDLQSLNGTSVNGVAISSHHRLQPNDEITAGNLRFRISWQQ